MATSGGDPLPLEQSAAWEQYALGQGQPLAATLMWKEDGKPVAVAAFYRHEMVKVPFWWAKRGPVWLKEATPEREKELRDTLRRFVSDKDWHVSFVRMHATYSAPDLHEPMRVIGYDRTVIIDGGGGNQQQALDRLPKDGRRAVNRALKKMAQMDGSIQQEEINSVADFAPYYALLQETASRDGFTPHPIEHYAEFLTSLGSHGRLYSARVGGELAAWDIVGFNGKIGSAFYGASSQLSREAQAVVALDFEIARRLGEEGAVGLDLMGIHSPRTPELFGVGRYKSKFGPPVDVPGLWDFPVKKSRYQILSRAHRIKRALKDRSEN